MKLRQSVKLDHLFAITDHNAVLQHAKFSVPARKEGYTVDDNARALVFAVKAKAYWPTQPLSKLQRKLISFLLLMQAEDGKFHNLMDYSLRIIDNPTVGDHLGRAIWAAGSVINSDLPNGLKAPARVIFDRALPWARESSSPRTMAYACLGLCERFQVDAKDPNLRVNIASLADSLVDLYNANHGPDWKWFENIISYDNARLPQALLSAYHSLGADEYLKVAQETFRFLQEQTTIEGKFVPIGSMGWYARGKERALYDQQPLEAGTMVEAAAIGYKITGSEVYERALREALGWFFGLNTKSVNVYDEATGASHDGITEVGLNENQGSESTISLLLATATFLECVTKG
ncbi:MAG: hypothetical protein ABSF00_00365 [Candidatus Bathyarchaeia archaeon]|jgi:hypothetical protein